VDSEIRAVRALSSADHDAMFELHACFFDNLKREYFDADLAEKDHVILLRAADRIVGFSTVKSSIEQVEDRTVAVVFSGDTIVHPDFWRRNALMPCFAAFMKRCLARYGSLPVYWNLVSKGCRTYLMLPSFFKRYYPSVSGPVDEFERRLTDWLGAQRFGGRYDPATAVALMDGQRDYLGARLAGIPAPNLTNRHVAFFLERNPGYVRGDELVCVAEVCESNLTGPALKMITVGDVRWVE
jgi:hypothetical protein